MRRTRSRWPTRVLRQPAAPALHPHGHRLGGDPGQRGQVGPHPGDQLGVVDLQARRPRRTGRARPAAGPGRPAPRCAHLVLECVTPLTASGSPAATSAPEVGGSVAASAAAVGQRDDDRRGELDLRGGRGRARRRPPASSRAAAGAGTASSTASTSSGSGAVAGPSASRQPPRAAGQLADRGAQPQLGRGRAEQRVQQHPVAAAQRAEHRPGRRAGTGARQSRHRRAAVSDRAPGVQRGGQRGHGGAQAERVHPARRRPRRAAGRPAGRPARRRTAPRSSAPERDVGAGVPAQRAGPARRPPRRRRPWRAARPAGPGWWARRAGCRRAAARCGRRRAPTGRRGVGCTWASASPSSASSARHLRPAGQERLGADVEGHPGQVDRAQHAAGPVPLLQHGDLGVRPSRARSRCAAASPEIPAPTTATRGAGQRHPGVQAVHQLDEPGEHVRVGLRAAPRGRG